MKKLLSIFIVLSLFLNIGFFSAFAEGGSSDGSLVETEKFCKAVNEYIKSCGQGDNYFPGGEADEYTPETIRNENINYYLETEEKVIFGIVGKTPWEPVEYDSIDGYVFPSDFIFSITDNTSGYCVYKDGRIYNIYGAVMEKACTAKELALVIPGAYSDTGTMFMDEFIKNYNLQDTGCHRYGELYYERNEEKIIEWALVFAEGKIYPWEAISYGVLNNVVVRGGFAESYPWKISYGIYDVKEDKWYDIMDVYQSEKYKKVLDVFVENDCGRLIGDIDWDTRISINDATYMQQCLAQLKEFPSDDEIQSSFVYGRKIKYISDFNEDMTRDIVDVTEIQKYLAGIKKGCCI